MGLMWSICGSGSEVESREERYKVDANGNDEPPRTYSWDRRGDQDPKNYIFDGIENNTVGKLPGQIDGQQFIIQNCNVRF
uniref:Uncharacterized protein n=1 Tax=Plectus sambesii TaxID=2011161 RepID=A0A914XK55_9BILA